MPPVIDAATDQTTPVAPAAVNQTADTTAPVPAAPAAPGPIATIPGAPNPAQATPPPPQGNAPGAQIPKQSFKEGMAAQGTPSYHTDENGNVTSNQPVRAPAVKGILGQILMGALEGASRGAGAQAPEGARGKGAAFSAGAAAATKGRIDADNRARAIAQQNFENRQAATAAKVRTQQELAQTALITQNMNFAADAHPGVLRAQGLENEEAELRLRGTHQKLLEDGVAFKKDMASQGIDPTSFSEHSPELTAQVKPLVGGAARAVHNGQAGDGNGVDIYPKSLLQAPITSPVTYNTYDGALDKDGVPMPTQHVITPDGKTTADDYLNKYYEGQAQLTRMAQQTHADMTMREQKAKIGTEQGAAAKDWATANLSNAEAENLKNSGMQLPATYKPIPNARVLPAADVKKQLTDQGIQLPNDFDQLWAIDHMKGDIKDYPSRVTKGSGQKSLSQAATQIRALIDPDFDETKFPAIKKQVEEFSSVKPNTAGGNIVSFNTATSHLQQLYTASQALQNRDPRAWNQVANAYGLQTGASPKIVFDAIRGALVGELGKTFKGGPADIPERADIEKTVSSDASPTQISDWAKTEARLMQSKSQALINQYYAWTGELPPNAIDAHTAAAFKGLGIDPYHGLPTGAKVGESGNTNPAQPPAQTPKPFVNTAGQSFTPDAQGQFTSQGWIWQVQPDGTHAKALKPATPAQ